MSKKLGQLLEKMEYELVQGSLDTEVTDLAYDSRKITEGMLFVAIAGTVVDGHKFIPDVLKKGASVIVMERDVKVEDDQVTVVKVKNARAALSYLSAAYFDYPATKMISIGITGTKGKSTTTYMIRDIIEKEEDPSEKSDSSKKPSDRLSRPILNALENYATKAE